MFAARNAFMTGKLAAAPVVFISSNKAADTNSVAIPGHAIGDLLVIFACAPWSNTVSKPAASGTIPNWNTIYSEPAGSEFYTHVAWAVATANNSSSGTWTNAYQMQVAVLSGQGASPIGGFAATQGYNWAPTAPSVTMTNTDGSSQLLHFAASAANGTFSNNFLGVSGYTGRNWESGARSRLVTKDDTTSDGSRDMGALAGASGNKACTATIEIVR